MYDLMDDLVLFSDREGTSVISKISRIYKRARSGDADIKKDAYGVIREMLQLAAMYGFSGNLWQSMVASYIAFNENPFSLAAEMTGSAHDIDLAKRDCRILKKIFEYDFSGLEETIGIDCIDALTDYRSDTEPSDAGALIEHLKERLAHEEDFYRVIRDFYAVHGVGTLGLNKAFTVRTDQGKAQFIPVRKMADIRLSDLVGYQVQKEKLVGNTEAFLKCKPANNVLLFGDGGTGKSTSIRALANQYSPEGLRIIQVYRHQMQYLGQIITQVKSRNYRFIIYMDDLSFEEFEIEYKFLKAVIEGGLEPRPENVLIYATSNRRHLIKETWKDRDDMEHVGDMHRSDSMEEKLSLADRFGVQIYYGKPTREEFHHIVEVLAIKEKIDIDSDVLHSEANKWEVRHGGVSGRSARQFIDYIKGTEVDTR